MIEFALSIAAFLFLAWCLYIAVIIVAWIGFGIMLAIIEIVLWPIVTVVEFVGNLRRHRP